MDLMDKTTTCFLGNGSEWQEATFSDLSRAGKKAFSSLLAALCVMAWLCTEIPII